MSSTNRRVLHVINGEHYSGAERVQDLLALRLPDHGFDVGFIALKHGRFGDVRRSVDAPLEELIMSSRWDFRAVEHVARVIREGGYELVHAHTPRSALIGSLAAWQAGVPLVYHVHSPARRDSTRRLANWINHHVERWSVANAARLVTVSPTLTDHMRSVGFDPDRIACVPNGVPEVDGATPRPAPHGAWTLGMVALFRPRKGAEVLIEALAALRSQGVDVRLRAIGPFESEDYEAELRILSERLGVADAVHWVGFTEDVGRGLAQVDALVLPSLFGEGLPMVILEAMAAGLPVVATRCEGTAEAVVHRDTGLLVEAGSVSQLSQALGELITGGLDYAAMSRRSLDRHAARFSDQVMAGRVADVYREILGAGGFEPREGEAPAEPELVIA